VTFGIDSATVTRYERLGRVKFLDEQLHPPADDPPDLSAGVAALSVSQQTAEQRMHAVRAEQQRINGLATEELKQQARVAQNQAGTQALYETTKRHLMRAVKSPAQLREQMTWFWMNHFSVFAGKANVRWTLAEYEESVRTHALGRFSDLVLATVTSPAMLEYLDNAQSSAGRINENYARELMELHTLGVSGGPSGSRYSQQDVQELARVLTGVGLNLTDNTPRFGPAQQPLYIRRGLFEFNPARHDKGEKTVLGTKIHGKGFDEVEDAVTMLCRQPATARFVSTKLAQYFVADDPPPALVDRMARTFQKTDGSIAAVLRAMFLDKDFSKALDAPELKLEKFKDPMQFVASSLRLAYEEKTLTNYHPAVNWLQQLGEPLYGRVTPDGYPLTEPAWTSSGQLVRRFEIARAIGSGGAGLFNAEDNSPGPATGFPMLTSRLYRFDRARARQTHQALEKTSSQQEWNTIRSPHLTGCNDDALTTGSVEAGHRRCRAPVAARPRHCLAGLCRAGRRRREVPARLPARRLRRRERRDSRRQRFLLRVSPDDRDPEAGPGESAVGGGARARSVAGVGAASGAERLDAAVMAERAARVRAVRRHRRSHAEPLRDAGQRRDRYAGRVADGQARDAQVVRIRLPQSARRRARRSRRARVVHGRAPHRHDRRHRRAERLVEGDRTSCIRRPADGAARGHVRGHAFRAADRGRL
jgi:uncharacterized protein (DUF1800 family)